MSTPRDRAAAEPQTSTPRRLRVPLLVDVRVAAPCDASWDEMTGDERVRFCDHCQKHVYNLSAMARDDAEQLIADTEGSVCVRMYQRADGMVLTSDCPEGVRLRRRKRVAAGVAAFGIAASAAAALVTQRRPLGEVETAVMEAPEAPETSAPFTTAPAITGTAAPVATGVPVAVPARMGDIATEPSGQPVSTPPHPFRPTAGKPRIVHEPGAKTGLL
jgi:hypothetical protein